MKWIRFLVTGFGAGRAPVAPGTFGTLVAIPFVVAFHQLSPMAYMGLTLLVSGGAIILVEYYQQSVGTHDSSEIVIDEIAGYLVSMTWLPVTWRSMTLSFVFFRILDAAKPFPISYLDEKMKGGVGVVADDLAAGLIANIAMQIIFVNTNWLGVQAV